MLLKLSQRADQKELMERPDRDEALTLRTVDQFRTCNALVSRYRAILGRWIISDMRQDPTREYHLADLGAGGLDIDEWLARTARAAGLKLRITAVECDSQVVAHVRRRAKSDPAIEVVCADALEWLRTTGPIDYVFCNHFLHHLPEPLMPEFLRLVAKAAKRRFVISDLLRSRWSYLGFWILAGVLFHRSYTWADGLVSIRRGFLPNELRETIRRAGLSDRVTVHSMVPGRVIIVGGSTTTEDLPRA